MSLLKKIIPVISFNAILQMDTADISSLGLCCKVREITKRKELRTWHLSWFSAQKKALGHLRAPAPAKLLLLLSDSLKKFFVALNFDHQEKSTA